MRRIPDLLAAMARQAGQRVGRGQQLHLVLLQARPPGKFLGAVERRGLPLGCDALGAGRFQSGDHARPEADYRRFRQILQHAVHRAMHHVHRPHLDAVVFPRIQACLSLRAGLDATN